MKKVAVLPLRAGSKSIIGKNKKKLLGRPLYQWMLGAAIDSLLDEIFVMTDDNEIIDFISHEYKHIAKVKVLKRSKESASDTASTESVLLEFSEKINYNFDLLCLLQATSPLTKAKDIDATINKVLNDKFNSALTVVENKRFVWNEKGEAINYDYMQRPRRQDFNGMLIENGAVYAIEKETFIRTKNRLGGSIGVVKMNENTLIEIDELPDWRIVSELQKEELRLQKVNPDKIKFLILDVDGVFTNGTVGVSENGELFKVFSLRDGMGLEILRSENIEPIVMTSENSPIVAKRMEKLKIKHCFLGVKDKYQRLNDFCKMHNISRSNIAYIGDDINDLSNILSVGWGFCPSDAVDEVKDNADIVLNNYGGDKAIRECVNIIIKYNSRF
nr:HAD hydrolase family protein [uncultured Carboxylicivirga sp.]